MYERFSRSPTVGLAELRLGAQALMQLQEFRAAPTDEYRWTPDNAAAETGTLEAAAGTLVAHEVEVEQTQQF